jgi:hypothetical protein
MIDTMRILMDLDLFMFWGMSLGFLLDAHDET